MTVFKIGERVRYRDCSQTHGTVIPMSVPSHYVDGYYNIDCDGLPTEVKHWSILVSVDHYSDFEDRIKDRLG